MWDSGTPVSTVPGWTGPVPLDVRLGLRKGNVGSMCESVKSARDILGAGIGVSSRDGVLLLPDGGKTRTASGQCCRGSGGDASRLADAVPDVLTGQLKEVTWTRRPVNFLIREQIEALP